MEKVFPEGLIYKAPREGTPEFVKGSLSIKVDEFTAFLQKHNNNGWTNLDFLKSQKGTLYFALNEWKPENAQPEQNTQTSPNIPQGTDKSPQVANNSIPGYQGIGDANIKTENIPF